MESMFRNVSADTSAPGECEWPRTTFKGTGTAATWAMNKKHIPDDIDQKAHFFVISSSTILSIG